VRTPGTTEIPLAIVPEVIAVYQDTGLKDPFGFLQRRYNVSKEHVVTLIHEEGLATRSDINDATRTLTSRG
jgi:hypothetical protein